MVYILDISIQAALTDWLGRHKEVERSGVNSHVRLAATLAQSRWRIERQWGVGRGDQRSCCWVRRPLEKSAPSFKDTSIYRLASKLDSVLKNSFALISAPGSKAENGEVVVFWPCFGALWDRRPGRHRLFQQAVDFGHF